MMARTVEFFNWATNRIFGLSGQYSELQAVGAESYSYLWENNSIQTTMKKLYLLLAFTLLLTFIYPHQSNAQWYKKYGVTSVNELSEDQCRAAMGKATNITRTGKRFVLAGGIYAGVGGIAFIAAKSSASLGGELFFRLLGASGIFMGGGLAAIGIPIWIAGAGRKAKNEKLFAKFPAKGTLSPRIIQDFNHYSMGLSVAIRF